MDGQALIIEIGRRAKAKERAKSGAPVDDAEDEGKTEDDSGDYDEIKTSAAEDIIASLGLDPKDVDVPAFASALQDFTEACSMKKKAD